MNKLTVIPITALLIAAFALGDLSVAAQDEAVTFECIQSFEYFAYAIQQEEISEADQLDITWIPQYQFPEPNETGEELIWSGWSVRVLFSRTVNGKQEIWLAIRAYPQVYDQPMFGVYHVDDGSLTLVPRRIGEEFSVSMANELMVDDNGTIWASTGQYTGERILILPGMEDPYPSTYASVAVFDDAIRRFVPFSSVPQISVEFSDESGWERRVDVNRTQLVIDANGVPWLFTEANDVYRFDSTTNTFQWVQQLDETFYIRVLAMLDDNMLIFRRARSEEFIWAQVLPVEEYIFELNPITGELQGIPKPPIALDTGHLIFVDRYNRTWFSAMAYLQDGQWTVVNPDPEQTQDFLGQVRFPIVWTFPTPILSDSAGRLWFETRGDNNFGTHGTAWLDPETGNGCKFTNSTSNIIEDHNGFLWLFDPVTRALYRSAEPINTRRP